MNNYHETPSDPGRGKIGTRGESEFISTCFCPVCSKSIWLDAHIFCTDFECAHCGILIEIKSKGRLCDDKSILWHHSYIPFNNMKSSMWIAVRVQSSGEWYATLRSDVLCGDRIPSTHSGDATDFVDAYVKPLNAMKISPEFT